MLFCSLTKPPGDRRTVEVSWPRSLSIADRFVTHSSSVNCAVEAQHWLGNRSWCWVCQCGSRDTIPMPSFGIFVLTGFIWVLPKCTCVSWMLVLSPFPSSYKILTRGHSYQFGHLELVDTSLSLCFTVTLKKWGNVRVKHLSWTVHPLLCYACISYFINSALQRQDISFLFKWTADSDSLNLSSSLTSDYPGLIFSFTDGLTCICSLTEGARTQLTCKTTLSRY